jgi:hypothetical protein
MSISIDWLCGAVLSSGLYLLTKERSVMAHVINNVSDQRALLLAEEHVTNEYRVKLDTGEVVFWSKTISSLETSGGSIRRHVLDKCCN